MTIRIKSTTHFIPKMQSPLRGLYAITDPQLIPDDQLHARIEDALRAGTRLIQYRNKQRKPQTPVLRAVVTLCEQHNALLIINDDVALAAQIHAHGVHIGSNDMGLKQARALLGNDAIIGVSCYNTLDSAVTAQTQGADYVAFGSFFSSPTKPDAIRADIELLAAAKQRLSIPVCAIGGITAENAGPLVAAGADMIAVISDVFGHDDVFVAAQRFGSLF